MDQVEEVKSKVDIVDVISSYVPLKKAGRNFSGLCPFHGEKTPSFMVSAERQVFKCFGCGEGGDVLTFLEKIEGWEFREALEELAKRAGVKLKNIKPSAGSRQKERLLKIHSIASKFYSYLLDTHKAGEVAREYLKMRGIKEETWRRYGVGYAPNSWDQMYLFLKKKGFSDSEVAASGFVIARQGGNKGFYDRFRDRIVFPIKDARGDVVGFSGRVIREVDDQPKYVNSAETQIFHKGSLLFGLDVARDSIRENNDCLMVEGEFDVLSSYQAGVGNVVASKGTALTEKQIALIARLSENITLGLDSDFAGDKAARKGIEMMDAAGLNIRVMSMGKYKDPDEFSKSDSENFKKAFKKAVNIYDYYLSSVSGRLDMTTPVGKKKAGEELLSVFGKITDDIVRAHYTQKLARLLDIDVSLVANAVEKKTTILTVESGESVVSGNRKLNLEEYFLALFLHQNELSLDFFKILAPDDFENGRCGELWGALRDIIRASKTRKVKTVLDKVPEGLSEFVDYLYLVDIGNAALDEELAQSDLLVIAKRIKSKSVKKQLVRLTSMIKDAEKNGENTEVLRLSGEFDKLSKYLKEQNA